MAHPLSIFATLTLAASLGACAQSPAPPVDPLAEFYVPTTLILPSPAPASTPAAQPTLSALAFQVLPAANDEDFFFPRAEKVAYGLTTLESLSTYSILVYDAQRISSPRGTGYRYTWATQEGVAYP